MMTIELKDANGDNYKLIESSDIDVMKQVANLLHEYDVRRIEDIDASDSLLACKLKQLGCNWE